MRRVVSNDVKSARANCKTNGARAQVLGATGPAGGFRALVSDAD